MRRSEVDGRDTASLNTPSILGPGHFETLPRAGEIERTCVTDLSTTAISPSLA